MIKPAPNDREFSGAQRESGTTCQAASALSLHGGAWRSGIVAAFSRHRYEARDIAGRLAQTATIMSRREGGMTFLQNRSIDAPAPVPWKYVTTD